MTSLKILAMKYRLRNLMLAMLVLPPLLAGGWFGYRWLHPSFSPLPPAINLTTDERHELLRYLNRMPRVEPLFDKGGPPNPVPVSQAPAPNPPSP